jgi:hypothetical protein
MKLWNSVFHICFLVLLATPHLAIASMLGLDIRLGSPSLDFTIANENKSLKFEPNPMNELTLGFLGDSFTFQLRMTYELGISADDEDSVRSTYGDYFVTLYGGNYVVDLYYQNYEGFYILEDGDEFTSAASAPQLNATNFGATFNMFFDDSFRLPESFGEFVTKPKSNDSFLWGGNFNIHTLDGNETIIPTKYASFFPKINQLESVQIDSIDIAGGYSFLHAWESWYISFYLIGGFGAQNRLLINADGEEINEAQSFVRGQGFFGLAYYNQTYQIGVRTLYNRINSQLDSYDYSHQRAVSYLYYLMVF